MNRRDRHGRLYDAVDADFAECYLSIRLQEIDAIARTVFVSRNAAGSPKSLPASVRQEVRDDLRQALKHAAQARDRLIDGNEQGFDAAHALARLAIRTAQARVLHADAWRVEKQRWAGQLGGRPRKDDQAAEWLRRYERLERTSRNMTAQERYEQIAYDTLGTAAKWRTVRNTISEYRKRQK